MNSENGKNIVQEKSYKFAIKVVKLYQFLTEKKQHVFAKQILRCGTSIGANIEEAKGAQTRKDFLTKCSIAYKEARETLYWLKLLRDTQYVSQNQFDYLYPDLEEILKLLTAILKTTRKNLL